MNWWVLTITTVSSSTVISAPPSFISYPHQPCVLPVKGQVFLGNTHPAEGVHRLPPEHVQTNHVGKSCSWYNLRNGYRNKSSITIICCTSSSFRAVCIRRKNKTGVVLRNQKHHTSFQGEKKLVSGVSLYSLYWLKMLIYRGTLFYFKSQE